MPCSSSETKHSTKMREDLEGQRSWCALCAGAGHTLKYCSYISICHYCFGSQVPSAFFQSHWRANRSHEKTHLLSRTAQSHAWADKLAVDIFHSVHLYKLHKKNAWGALVMNTSTFTLHCKNSYKEMISMLQRGYIG